MTDIGDPATGERRRRLLGVKLTALVTEHLGAAPDQPGEAIGAGAALTHAGGSWVLVDGRADRSLGAALAWSRRHGAASLDLVAEAGGGLVARRAAAFDLPIRVWFAEDRTLLPVVADPPTPGRSADPEHLALTDLIESAGAEPRVERGVVTGEVRGLEVCRVVDEPTTGNFAELSDVPVDGGAVGEADLDAAIDRREHDGVLLEVGVGANDREAFNMLHGHLPTVEALAGVVTAVTDHRRRDAIQHPLNRMAPERFLRWEVTQNPASLGLVQIEPADPPVDRLSMKHSEPCVARGLDTSGASVDVVFTVGVDLDLVAFVADHIVSATDPADRVVVVAPERDLLPITRQLVELLATPVELIAAPTAS